MGELKPVQKIEIVNDSGEDIPPRSVVVVTSIELIPATATTEAKLRHHVQKFNDQSGNIYVTPQWTIKASYPTGSGPSTFDTSITQSLGVAFYDQLIYVSIDPGISTPNPGEEWGPRAGQWYITRGGKGFIAQGWADTGETPKRALFYRQPSVASSSSGGTGGGCNCCDCFDCIDPSDATIGGCTYAPAGAAPLFNFNPGDYDNWPSIGGPQALYYGLQNYLCGSGSSSSSSSSSDASCLWSSCIMTACLGGSSSSSSATCGTYQWVKEITAVGKARIFLAFISGTNVLAI